MNSLKIKSPSAEFNNLAPEIREKIDEFLGEYPTKPGAMAKKLGVRVLVTNLPPGRSARIDQDENGIFVIRITRFETKPRQRFVLAHELAHFLLHKDRIIADGGWLESVLLRSGQQPDEIEYEANRLAYDLLVPSILLRNAIDECSSRFKPMSKDMIDYLAHDFRVVKPVMENCLTDFSPKTEPKLNRHRYDMANFH